MYKLLYGSYKAAGIPAAIIAAAMIARASDADFPKIMLYMYF
jgi:hypothetical protein